jgi:hypothetical protein
MAYNGPVSPPKDVYKRYMQVNPNERHKVEDNLNAYTWSVTPPLEEKEWTVERIIDVRTGRDGVNSFRMRFAGCKSDKDLWFTAAALTKPSSTGQKVGMTKKGFNEMYTIWYKEFKEKRALKHAREAAQAAEGGSASSPAKRAKSNP